MTKSMSRFVGIVASLGVVASTASAGTVLQSFKLLNHPDGAVSPSAYGLRLDQFPNPNPPGGTDGQVTFSFENPINGVSSTMTLEVIDNGGQIDIRMFGTIWGNSADNGTYLGEYMVDVTYTNLTNVGDGWTTNTTESIGTLTANDATAESIFGVGGTFALDSKGRNDGLVFSFRNATHRGNPGWNGYGWVNNPDTGPTEDWLFRAMEMPIIPLPTSAVLGLSGMGLLVISRRRRA